MPNAKKPLTPEQWREVAELIRKCPSPAGRQHLLMAATAAAVFGGESRAWECEECVTFNAAIEVDAVEEPECGFCGGTLTPLYAAPEAKDAEG